MRRVYDLAISLGGACACSKSLRKANLQYASFPFDWLNGATLRDRAELLVSGMSGWLEEGLEKLQEPKLCIGESHWRECRYGFGLLHDFDRIQSPEEALPAVKAKYGRRMKRLSDLIVKAKKVLLVWTDVPTSPCASDADVDYVLGQLGRRWPGIAFDFLLLRREVGLPFPARRESVRGALRTVTFDYMVKEISKYGVMLADDELLGRWLASEYEVRDYRSPEDIANWRRVSKLNRYRQFGGRNLITYLIGKLQYKIYKHIMKKLQQKGIAT